jgi:hypothetical protein
VIEDNISTSSETTQPDVTENSDTNIIIVTQQSETLATPDHMLHQANIVDEQDLADRASHDTGCITQIVDQTLEETPHDTIHDEYQNLYHRLTSILRDIRVTAKSQRKI